VDGADVSVIATEAGTGGAFLASLLQLPKPSLALRTAHADTRLAWLPLDALLAASPDDARPHLLAPLDRQEVWAAGVTYERSRAARMDETQGAERFYDLVYDAERPELFFKATPSRVAGPNAPVRIRADAAWSVPEPEVAVLFSPRLEVVGYTIGNDMSSRDIEGQNPLYLPQAKVYRECCALGPVIWLDDDAPEHRALKITMMIERRGAVAFAGETSTASMKRRFAELGRWLGRDNVFGSGVFLLTGTGLVPPNDFTLKAGDVVRITVPEIGTLGNPVVQQRA
jgi:2-dehydro-3-deoxy-D-arabinonate dehydratase